MRLAVVLHGIVGGMSDRDGVGVPVNILECYKTIKHNILSRYDHDIFVHSWTLEQKNNIINLYNPIASRFDQQEYFGFSESERGSSQERGQAYRTTSRYTSLERAIKLKQSYEKQNNFVYDWVIVLRFDLVFFTTLVLEKLDHNSLYICREPHWPRALEEGRIHDIVFLGASKVIDSFSCVIDDIRQGKINASSAHRVAFTKASEVCDNILYGFERYKDVEIYRMATKPELNPIGHKYGALELPSKVKNLLNELE